MSLPHQTCVPSNTCYVFKALILSKWQLLTALRFCPPSSVSVVSPIFHLLISRLHLSLWEERHTLSTRHRPRRLLVCRLEQSCLATLAAAGCCISLSLKEKKRFQSGVGIQRKLGVIRWSVMSVEMADMILYPPPASGTFLVFCFTNCMSLTCSFWMDYPFLIIFY